MFLVEDEGQAETEPQDSEMEDAGTESTSVAAMIEEQQEEEEGNVRTELGPSLPPPQETQTSSNPPLVLASEPAAGSVSLTTTSTPAAATMPAAQPHPSHSTEVDEASNAPSGKESEVQRVYRGPTADFFGSGKGEGEPVTVPRLRGYNETKVTKRHFKNFVM